MDASAPDCTDIDTGGEGGRDMSESDFSCHEDEKDVNDENAILINNNYALSKHIKITESCVDNRQIDVKQVHFFSFLKIFWSIYLFNFNYREQLYL